MTQKETINNKIERWVPVVFKCLVFLFPLCFGVVESWHSTILVVLVFISLFYSRGQWSLTEKEVKKVLFAFLVFLVVVSLSLINSSDFYESQKKLVKLFYLLGFFPLFLAARRLKLDLAKTYISGAMVGTLVMYGTALYQVQFLGAWRAQGVTHPIVFGDIAMVHGLLFVGYFLATPKRGNLLIPAGIAAFCAFGASFLSLTRGSWLAPPFVLFLLLFLFARVAKVKTIAVTCFFLLLMSAGVAGIYKDKISTQVQRTVHSVEQFLDGTKKNTSAGQRLMMWRIAFEMFKDNPLIGSGIADFPHDAGRMMEEGKTQLSTAWPHAHNIFFEALGTTGLAGMTAMTVALLILPFRYFYCKWRIASPEKRRSAVCGMILLTSFFVFGLTESWLSRSPFVSVYVVGLFAFFSTYLRPEWNEREEKI